jgi:hypothetical protein
LRLPGRENSRSFADLFDKAAERSKAIVAAKGLRRLDWASALNDTHEDGDDGQDQQNMDEPAKRVRTYHPQ